MRAIAIGGEPATGKTTLVNKIRSKMKLKKASYKKILNFEISDDNKFIILGKYMGNKFDGTDRLSMAVQPIAKEFMRENKDRIVTVLFEGDRLFNQSFLIFLFTICPVACVVLSSSESMKHKRHKDRDDTQTDKFLKGRETKINNICRSFPVIVLNNEGRQDLKDNTRCIMTLLKSKDKEFIKKEADYRRVSQESLRNKKGSSGILGLLKLKL